MAKNIRGQIVAFFLKNEGKTVSLDQICNELKLTPASAQSSINNLIKTQGHQFPLQIIARGRSWKYLGNNKKPEPEIINHPSVDHNGRFVAGTPYILVGYVNGGSGVVVRDPDGNLYRAGKM